jgi:hypothetical protein
VNAIDSGRRHAGLLAGMLLAVLAAGIPAALAAQEGEARSAAPLQAPSLFPVFAGAEALFSDESAPESATDGERRSSRRLGIAKWSTLIVSAGVGGYGFVTNDRAERAYVDLEQRCFASPEEICRERNPDGSFVDAELEREFQEVLRMDRRARAALVAAQVGVVATVVLFIMDMGGNGLPDTIPFTPPRLNVTPHGVGLEARVPVGGR